MKKIIGRGVLLLTSTKEKGLKFGYELSTEGILLSPLGKNASLQSLKKTLRNPSAKVKGKGNIILNSLPASPNDAFYDVTFQAEKVGLAAEFYTLKVKSPSDPENEAFAHGPQYFFSGLDLIYSYHNIGNTKPSVVSMEGKVFLHLEQGVFKDWEKLEMALDWNEESDTLIFSTAKAAHKFQMDAIGKLSKIVVELGQPYDRWAQVQGVYTFDGITGDIATHDISGQGAPSLYFRGDKNFIDKPNEPYAATWKDRGIALNGGVLASENGIDNTVVDAILQTESFSVEMWITPQKANHKNNAWIFSFTGKTVGTNYPYNFNLGQGPWHTEIDHPSSFAKARFRFPPLGKHPGIRSWEHPLESPANSFKEKQMHLVYSCGKDGMQRIYLNGIQVVERHNPDYLKIWGGNLRMIVGSDIPHMTAGNIYKGRPWKGEVHHLAIYNRALTGEEVNLHYLPSVKITGDISLDDMIAPLTDEIYPFQLTTNETESSLIASREVDFNIKPQLGFRKIYLTCHKLKDSPWTFAGKFQTRFWEDFFELNAQLGESGKLHLTSSPDQFQPINIPGIGVAKYRDILLKIGDSNEWELSFGAHHEFGLISMVLENAIPDYDDFNLGRPHLQLTDPIILNGNWLGEDMVFTSDEKKIGEVSLGKILKGSTSFDMIFSLIIPASIHETNGISNGEDIKLIDTTIHISLDVELQKEGFFAKLNRGFDYTAPSGVKKNISLPERRLYQSPTSKNALLQEILEEIKMQADDLFVELRSHQEDYYLEIKSDVAIINYYGSSTSENGILSVIPDLFHESDILPAGTAAITIIKNEEDNFCLKLNLAGKSETAIQSAYEDFFKEPSIANLDDSATVLLKRRIAERLPLNYKQVLNHYYGWNSEKNYLDLQPGMRLRIDFQNYQFVQASDSTALRGFAGSGGYYVQVNSYTHPTENGELQLVGFGPFVSRLGSNNQLDLKDEGAGGVLDLLKTGHRKAFYRLVFPHQTTAGVDPERLVTFIGADSLENLEISTQEFLDGEVFTTDSVHFFFRGKAMVIPEIQIYVGESSVYVPVGTTMRQLIEMYDDLPGVGLTKDLGVFKGKSRPLRRIHEGRNSQPEYRFINITAPDGTATNTNILDLPLIKGDRFYF